MSTHRARNLVTFMLAICLAALQLPLTATPAAAAPLFSDGFESGDLSAWTNVNGMVVQSDEVDAGAFSARATAAGSQANVTKVLSPAQAATDLYYRARFKVMSLDGKANLMRVFAPGQAVAVLQLQPSGALGLTNLVDPASSKQSTIEVDDGAWHSLQLRVHADGATGQAEVWLDGARVDELSYTGNHFGTDALNRIRLGETSSTNSDVVYDDVVVDTERITLDDGMVDTEDPTVPQDLAASLVGADVQLTWSASSDNEAVTGYDVFRDDGVTNEQIASLGALTTYTDIAPGAGTFDYTVIARDAAGNLSDPSDPAQIVVPVVDVALFSDGFESGDLSAWTNVNGMVVQSDEVDAGAFSARATATGNHANVAKVLSPAQAATDLYYRARFKVMSLDGKANLMRVFAPGQAVAVLQLQPSGALGLTNLVDPASSKQSTIEVDDGAWHSLQLRVHADGANGQAEVWLDGARVDELSYTGNHFGTDPLHRIRLGETSSTNSDVVYDDVVVDTERITLDDGMVDTEDPTVPQDLAASLVGADVQLTWSASSDNEAVTGYDIFRDDGVTNQQIASVGALTTYTDVAPGAGTFDYTVIARDAAGNLSDPSDPAQIVVPVVDVALFSDGFESGDLSAWTNVNGMVVQSDEVDAGAFSARATATGGHAHVTKAIEPAQAATDLYYRARFKVMSLDGKANLMRVSAPGQAIAALQLQPSGNLALHNYLDPTSSKQSTIEVDDGAWHSLQLRVHADGANGQAEVWLDGARVDELSYTGNHFGTDALNRIRLGETSSTNSDVVYDDVVVDTEFIDLDGPDVTPPAAPTGLMATAGDGQVDLNWDDNTDDATNYDVYRSETSPVEINDGNRIGDGVAVSEFTDTTAVNGTTYFYVVTARDAGDLESAASNEVSATPMAAAAPCAPYSPLPCAEVPVDLDYFLTFDGTEGGVVDDADGGAVGTGFTMIQPSGSVLGPYRPDLLNVAGGNLTIEATNGIQYRVPDASPGENLLDNGLGVGIDPDGPFQIETTVIDPPSPSSQSQQAGLWFGPDQDNYVKLVVVTQASGNVRVQLLHEQGGGAPGNPTAAPPELNGAAFSPTGATIRLIMTADPGTGVVTGSYTVNGGSPVSLPAPSSFTVPASFFDDPTITSAIPGATTTAGIFTSRRNSTQAQPEMFTFGEFSIAALDVTPPAAPTGLIATPGDGTVTLDWDDNTDDAVNYDVYRSTKGVPAIDDASRIADGVVASTFNDTGLTNGITYYYRVTARDADDNESDPSDMVSAAPNGSVDPVDLKVNFQSETAPVPTGYVRDFGQPFGLRTGVDQGTGLNYGWFEQNTLDPLSLVGNGRDRGLTADQREDTLMHMQAADISGAFGGVKAYGYWEVAVPDGTYDVTVSAGDPSVGNVADPESHTINVEGVNAIDDFVPTGLAGEPTRWTSGSVQATVTDGLLTIDAVGGQNTKIQYVDIATADTAAPAAPTGLVATAGDGVVDLDWDDNTDDATNYDVYRSETSPVSIEDGNRIGDGVVTSDFSDTTAVNGTTYFYVVTARDAEDNESGPSNEVSATPEGAAVACDPYSPLPCDQVPVSFPYAITFDGTEGGVVDDADGGAVGTGFTMIQPSGSTAGPYLPENLNVAGGNLTIETTGGIQYKSATTGGSGANGFNNLDNGLGVGIDGSGTDLIRLETTLPGLPVFRNTSEQAGIWLGPDQDNYVKLVVAATGANLARIQLLREIAGVSTAADEVNSASQNLNGATVRLILVMDPVANTATASYAIGAGAEVPLGQLTGLPDNITDSATIASAIPGATTTAGVFTTHRNATTPTTFSFSEFSITEEVAPVFEQKVNFQSAAAPVPVGYVRDFGEAYGPRTLADQGSGLTYGWVEPGTTTPLDLSTPGNGRDRNLNADQRYDTLMHMQYNDVAGGTGTSGTPAPGSWEIAVPNGEYDVTVAVGDADEGGADPESHTINVEGVNAISAFVPTGADGTATRHETATVTDVVVNDGRLTVDAIGGTNTKIDFVDLAGGDQDTTAPAAPTGLAATAGDGQVDLDWDDNTDDATNYDVYRSESSPVSIEDGNRIGDGVAVSEFTDGSAVNGTTYFYVVTARDAADNESDPSNEVSATPEAGAAPFDLKVNFQNPGAVVPVGYVRDFGEAYGPRTGADQGSGLTYGWVEPGTTTPRDLSLGGSNPGNGRERNLNADQRYDTLMHMQYDDVANPTNGTALPGSWEVEVPNGTYDVTVAAGDAQGGADPESHTINVEGVNAISAFVPTGADGSATRHETATVTDVVVNDGRLTVDASGGTNTKINFVDIAGGEPDSEPPAAPTGVQAVAGNGQVALNWDDNGEGDIAGYFVYRSQTTPVDTTTAVNPTALAASAFTDTGLTNGTEYFYVIKAEDTSGNLSPASDPAVSATPVASALEIDVNFQNAAAPVPTGYVRDFGEAYGPRSGADQGTGLTYGWVQPGTSTPLDLSVGGTTPGNGRDRNAAGVDQRYDTLMHMQGDDVPMFNGTPQPGSWEIALPNGTYAVTVAAGDPNVNTDPEAHTINVEGNTAIDAYLPTGALGSATRSTTASVIVRVQDGRLTLGAEGGTNTKIHFVDISSDDAAATRPAVTGITPAAGATDVDRDSGLAATVSLPNVGQGVDGNTLDASTVQLTRASDQAPIAANLNTSGGGDVIVIQPAALLDENTKYVVEITSGVKDLSGAAFLPFTSTFTTGTGGGPVGGGPVEFDQVALSATGKPFTSLEIGPDGKLYAATLEGEIVRYTIAGDGTLSAPQTITSLQTANGGNQRMLIGLEFDPAATAVNPILWVTHSAFAFNGGPDWAGKLTRMSGPNLETVQDYVINLPRSIRDHLTNSLQFGPDGAIYFLQGSNSAMGAPDGAWGNRSEHLLNAAVLRFDPTAVASPPLDAKTEEGGTYDPFAGGAPLTIFSSGIRNAYDLWWHSNGSLYVPTNGSAAGGNTPGTPATLPASCQNRIDDAVNGDYTGPQVPGITNVTATQNDFLFRAVQGGYYGHPNPSRCEWVLNGGDPTAGTDVAQVTQYPDGTQPDRNWRGSAFNFGNNKSPNGIIEYESNLFGGSLDGKLLVVRYSQNDDIIVLTPGAGGDIASEQTGLPGMTGFQDPLDLTEDPSTGNIYVTELAASKITLLRAVSTGGGEQNVALSPDRQVFNDVSGGAASAPRTIEVDNTGGSALTVSGLSLTGADAGQFQIVGGPTLPAQVPAGGSLQVPVAFNPTSIGVKGAALQVTTDDPDTPQTQATLRGLGTQGLGGSNEPSLQWILDTYEHDIDVGDPNPADNALPTTSPLGDEVVVQTFQKAGAGNVVIEPLAVFGPDASNPVLSFGWYPAGNTAGKQQLFTVSNSPASNAQTLNVPATGSTAFDPGAQAFGLYSAWPFFGNRSVYQEDALNTFAGAIPHHVRVYELRDDAGAIVPDAYVVATEETTSGFDYQDVVAIVRNVEPALPPSNAEISLTNLDGVPFPDRLVFSRIGSLASPPANGVHDVATVRVHNTGSDPLSITSLPITGPWQLDAPIALPATVPSGGQLDIAVQFVATTGAIHNGTLTIVSNDADEPSTVVELSGFWQSVSEGGQEPDVAEISEVLGYGTEIVGAGEQLNQNGFVTAVGDEVLSPYWRRADTTKVVSVRQLAAYHTQGNTATVAWHQFGSNTAPGIFTHAGIDGQSMLPRLNGQLGQPAAGSFTPTSAVFGFKVDGEWSDPTKNNQTTDQNNGCPTPCGHHVRFWPVRDRQGTLIPDTYLMSMDYSGINYDYNDNVYLISNITPEDPALDPSSQALVPGSPSLVLEFDQAYPSTLPDGDTDTTGFTSTQANENDTTPGSNSFDPSLLDVDTTAGTLAVTTTIGSNANNDNTLHNGLRLGFDASLGEFVASVRLQGPLTDLTSGSRQGGVMFGPNQENYAKVVAINKGGVPSIEFWVEQNGTGATIGTTPAIPSPNTLDTLDLFLLANPASGEIRAAYRSIGTAGDSGLVVLPTSLTLTGQNKGRFFEKHANAGIITMHKGSASPIVVTFDRFAVEAGDPTGGPDTREALHRLDVAGAGNYTDTQGNEWEPDTGLFSPGSAIAEGGSVMPQEIANTDDDVIYRTYRGNVGAVPLAQRVLTYDIPTFGLETMDLRLHFAERASGNDLPGERLFDVEAEGDVVLDDFDIVAASGGQHTAVAVPIDGIDVDDGSLTLVFRAVADYASIAGIEVLCPGTCPEPDETPPGAPMGLMATASVLGVDLDWSNNPEGDLAGYNVYRSSAPGGPFTKLNPSLLAASQYTDATAPGGETSYYQVTAVDTSGNQSDPAATSADMPVVENVIRINTGGVAQSVDGVDWEGCASAGACNGYVSGGFQYTEGGSPAISGVPAGMNELMFQTEWTGGQTNGVPVGGVAFTFDVPVDNGDYLVRMHFAELNKNGANLRVFDVNIEGGPLELDNYDIWSEVGFRVATMKQFSATVADGDLTIQFIRELENAKISAIEIIPVA